MLNPLLLAEALPWFYVILNPQLLVEACSGVNIKFSQLLVEALPGCQYYFLNSWPCPGVNIKLSTLGGSPALVSILKPI